MSTDATQIIPGRVYCIKMRRGAGTVKVLRSVLDAVGVVYDAEVLEGIFCRYRGNKSCGYGSVICFRSSDVSKIVPMEK